MNSDGTQQSTNLSNAGMLIMSPHINLFLESVIIVLELANFNVLHGNMNIIQRHPTNLQ